MSELRFYRKRQGQRVIAVQLNLDTAGFAYKKWGAMQQCKPGDWLVQNGDSTYTVDQQSFAQSYRRLSDGMYEKVAGVWARLATSDGIVITKEGETHYQAGDYIVSNDPDSSDAYAIDAKHFVLMYESMPDDPRTNTVQDNWAHFLPNNSLTPTLMPE